MKLEIKVALKEIDPFEKREKFRWGFSDYYPTDKTTKGLVPLEDCPEHIRNHINLREKIRAFLDKNKMRLGPSASFRGHYKPHLRTDFVWCIGKTKPECSLMHLVDKRRWVMMPPAIQTILTPVFKELLQEVENKNGTF